MTGKNNNASWKQCSADKVLSIYSVHTRQKKLKQSRDPVMGILTLELLSMKEAYCRGPFSQPPPTPQSGIPLKAPILSLGKGTED